MRHTDIAVVGGGLAGSAAAAMLGRAGIATVLIDPHSVVRDDFRCEKLDASQLALLDRAGLSDVVLPATTPVEQVWVARYGRRVLKQANRQRGIVYPDLVDGVRQEACRVCEFIAAKVTAITTSSDRQTVTLSTGEIISARLVVLATGLNNGLRQAVGIARREISKAHSVSVGFDIRPVGQPGFAFSALTYHAERTRERIGYLTLFPVASGMRANLFLYRDADDPWLRALRDAPEETLLAAMPGLRNTVGAFAVASDVKIRPVDLYVTDGHRQPGVVLVGDAFATSCPAAGTGVNKVLTDVERLCHAYIPRWLASPGMDVEKIAAFYDDPEKRAADAHSAFRAFYVRSAAVDRGVTWRARRLAKFCLQLSAGWLSALRTPAAEPTLRPTPATAERAH
jgi:2-polyprenyl-6-methoxyphenol hydroxylase-like FAD-dependent oxidoreductase